MQMKVALLEVEMQVRKAAPHLDEVGEEVVGLEAVFPDDVRRDEKTVPAGEHQFHPWGFDCD